MSKLKDRQKQTVSFEMPVSDLDIDINEMQKKLKSASMKAQARVSWRPSDVFDVFEDA